MLMLLKKILRRFGFDVVRYHSIWDAPALQRIETILDIGANTGSFARDMRTRFPHARIISFEPLRDCFQTLTHAMQDDDNFKAYNVALGEVNGSMPLHRSSFHPSSSLLPMKELHKKLYPKSAGESVEQVEVAQLDDLVPQLSLVEPTLIKIDVQGFEDKVIAGGQKVFARAHAVLVETSFVELYEGQPLFDDIHEALRALGFCYRGHGDTHWGPQNELIYQDSLFVKETAV